jgi:hypothetical protein
MAKRSVAITDSAENVIAALKEDEVVWITTHHNTLFLGVQVVQSPGAWTSIGLTWRNPLVGEMCVGDGVAEWRTDSGLGQLATVGRDFKPHEKRLIISPYTNLMFKVPKIVLEKTDIAVMKSVAEFANRIRSELPPEAFICGPREVPKNA